jgi:hypothetical protein
MNAAGGRTLLPNSHNRNGFFRPIFALLVMIVLVALGWVAWDFQPWLPEGRVVHLQSARLDDLDFQIWQRKNQSASEPFATGLFVRKQGGAWTAYLLDFEDVYRPTINLRKEGAAISIYYGSYRRAYFDEEQWVLRRDSDSGSVVSPAVMIDSEPPGDWWQRLSTQ